MNEELHEKFKNVVYEDTFNGAVEFLKEETELKVDGAHGIPDPVVDGCWLIHLPYGHAKVVGCSVLVWLFGVPMSPVNMPDFDVFPYQPHVKPNYP